MVTLLNKIFFAKLNLITSFSIYESLRKKESSVSSECEVRGVINFLNVEGDTLLVIHRKLCNVYDAT